MVNQIKIYQQSRKQALSYEYVKSNIFLGPLLILALGLLPDIYYHQGVSIC